MKVIKAVPKILYHCFKLLQIGMYVLVASELLEWTHMFFLAFLLLVLLLPTVALYVASCRCSGKSLMVWKAAHGVGAPLGYLAFAITMAICFDLHYGAAAYMFFFMVGTIPVMVEGLVAYVLWKRNSPQALDHMPLAG
ncbi:MAG: hypothetical protein ACYC1M_00990 [Armatimonadota bacterium]